MSACGRPIATVGVPISRGWRTCCYQRVWPVWPSMAQRGEARGELGVATVAPPYRGAGRHALPEVEELR